jgi:hypothetical protein
MTMSKKCTLCEVETDNFGPNKMTLDKLESQCRDCKNNYYEKYCKSKKGLVAKIYSTQRACSRHRGHQLPNYTLDELREWCYSQDNFNQLFEDWENDNYSRFSVPSCDRIDNDKGYSLDNIQLVAWRENLDNCFRDMKVGKIVHWKKRKLQDNK